MFLETYQQELAHLRAVGRAFGAQHPSVAGLLAEAGHDPDVERLLEGFAFVAARLRERIDQMAPELVENLFSLFIPHALRPVPPCTIVGFEPAPRSLRGRRRLEAGTRLASTAIDGTHCTFTTTRPLDILPLTLLGASLDDTRAGHPEISLKFALEPGAGPSVFTPEGIRLHLSGETATTTQLALWLTRHLTSVCLRVDEAIPIELGVAALRPVGFDDADRLLPWPQDVSHGIRRVHEYFTLPAKFAFFDLTNLERAAPLQGERFEIVLRFATPSRLPAPFARDTVRIHCVPAINLFEVDAEPVRTDACGRATLLRADALAPEHMEVFDVRAVVGSSRRHGRRSVPPAQDFEPRDACYHLHRRRSPLDDGLDTFLSVQRTGEAALDAETLSITLRCTNRSLARNLPVGALAIATADVGAGLRFRNIIPATAPRRPALGASLLHGLLAHLGHGRAALSDPRTLAARLSLMLPDERDTSPQARALRGQLDAIAAFDREGVARVFAGIVARGVHHRLTLRRSGFASDGEAYLFSQVIALLVADEAPLNSFSDLTACLDPDGCAWRFEAKPRT